ncbi:MAG: hypothetical protein KDA42_04570 [Planctomycetales bacterium]|nr:hypothetical protein [Planctomycetales bacterium]
MRSHWVTGLAVGLIISGVSFSFAGDSSKASESLFGKLDANSDGKLTAEEAPEQHRRLFERLLSQHDENGDGSLSVDEFQAGTQSRRGQRSLERKMPAGQPLERVKMMLKRLDANGDQTVEKSEVPEVARPFFERLLNQVDENGDGALGREEFEAQASQIAKFVEQSSAQIEGRPQPEMIFARLDQDKNGSVEEAEVPQEHRERFQILRERADKNADGALSRDEFVAGFGQLARGPQGAGKGQGGRDGKGPGTQGAGRGPGKGPEIGRGSQGGPGGGRDFVEGMMRRLKELDTNGDEKISRDEAEKAERLKPHFDEIDANSDDYLDRDEVKKHIAAMAERFRAGRGPQGGPGGPGRFAQAMMERLKQLDTNGDEKISRDEASKAERLKEHFDKIDANGDGNLDKAEIKSHMEQMMKQFQSRRPEGAPGERGGAKGREGRPPRDNGKPVQ